MDIIGAGMIVKPLWNVYSRTFDESFRQSWPKWVKDNFKLGLAEYDQHWIRWGFISLIVGFLFQIFGNIIQML